MYKLTKESAILRLSDGAIIPADVLNSDYLSYLAWIGAGNVAEPAAVPTLEERRAAVWEQIKAKRDHMKSSGVKVGPHWFHSDADSRIQQIGLVIMGAAIPAGLKWKALDDVLVDMTPTLAGEIFAATAAWDGLLFATAEAHRSAVMESAAPEDYDWQAGWPLGYGE